jgi:hypothetical protein
LSLCGITSSNPFPSVPKLYTAIASSSIYRMTVLTTIAGKSRGMYSDGLGNVVLTHLPIDNEYSGIIICHDRPYDGCQPNFDKTIIVFVHSNRMPRISVVLSARSLRTQIAVTEGAKNLSSYP